MAIVRPTVNQTKVYKRDQDAGERVRMQVLARASAAAADTALAPAKAAPAAVTPQKLNDYTWYGWMGDNKLTTMTDRDKANWNAAMQGWQNGDYKAYNDNFQTAGNWASYVDDDGSVSGMLRYVGDGVGGYVPVNKGQLLYNGWSDRDYAFYGPNGEVYTADANGRLARTGTWTPEETYSALESSVPYKLLKGTATDAEREAWTSQVNPASGLQKSAAAGDGDALGQLARQAAAAAPQQTSTPGGAARGSAEAPQQDRPSGGSPYQTYLDQWDYERAPAWEGSEYERKRDAALEAAARPWEGSEDQLRRDEALQRAEDMRWDYDPDADPVWQAYQKQYRREGRRAAQDALGQYAAMTGGVPSSYAVTAASQAGDYYAAQLSDRLPELYQNAYDRYLREYEKQLNAADRYAEFDDRAYARWADRQRQELEAADRYQSYGSAEYQRYLDRLGQYDADRSFDYGRYRDALGDVRYDDETRYSRDYQARRDALSDARYQQEQAQQLREYADAQEQKQTEWQQYLREYSDQLAEKSRRQRT